MTPHLTHDQLCDLLIAPTTPTPQEAGRLEVLRDHLSVCQQCSTEFSSLDQSLATFRSTTTAWTSHIWAQQQASADRLPHRRPSPSRILTLPALWTAAAALAVAATISLSMHRENPAAAPKAAQVTATTTQSPSTQSDEALLEEVDATLSSSIPSPMQPLNDPSAGLESLNNQRKN